MLGSGILCYIMGISRAIFSVGSGEKFLWLFTSRCRRDLVGCRMHKSSYQQCISERPLRRTAGCMYVKSPGGYKASLIPNLQPRLLRRFKLIMPRSPLCLRIIMTILGLESRYCLPRPEGGFPYTAKWRSPCTPNRWPTISDSDILCQTNGLWKLRLRKAYQSPPSALTDHKISPSASIFL